ncbi:MAG: hypothetical protein HKM04_01345 [Legionellales bacterium]|nr:hypothetical protein [Legionellales bacterium]
MQERNKKIVLIILLIGTFFLMNLAKAAGKVPIIIDTDASTDDAIALLYLLNSDKIDIKAIIVDRNAASFANTAGSHIAYVLNLAKKPLIPVYLGTTKNDNDYPVSIKKLVDDSYPENTLQPKLLISQKQLANIILSQQEPVKILCLGSLSNIADLFKVYPEVKNKISLLTIMGGAIDVPGNIAILDSASHNLYAEWNVFIDPSAFQAVLSSNIPIILVSLDITNKTPVTLDFLESLHRQTNNPEAEFVYKLLFENIQWIKNNEYDFWDPLAAFILVNPEQAITTPKRIKTVTIPGNHVGQTIKSSTGYPVNVVTTVSTDDLKTALLKSFL